MAALWAEMSVDEMVVCWAALWAALMVEQEVDKWAVAMDRSLVALMVGQRVGKWDELRVDDLAGQMDDEMVDHSAGLLAG